MIFANNKIGRYSCLYGTNDKGSKKQFFQIMIESTLSS